MPRTPWGWMVTAEELDSWILDNSDDVLAIAKPAHVVCHPTKHGPWSSLSSAVRERFGIDPVHLVSRLDRETSGVVLIGKTRESAAHLRVQNRRDPLPDLEQLMQKQYLAVLCGEMAAPLQVQYPLRKPEHSVFKNRQEVAPSGGQHAITQFEPVAAANGFTLVVAQPKTGRMHQIRVHAAAAGYPIAGDKLYPDESIQLEFLQDGWTPGLAERLPFERQALHAWSIMVHDRSWSAPVPDDLADFLERIGIRLSALPKLPF